MPERATADFTRSAPSSQPVVPTTMFTPSAEMRSTFSATAEGMENSIAASTPAKFSRVMPSKCALLNSSSFKATVKPYSGASCSISLPIFPYPTIASFMSHLVKDSRVKLPKKLGVQHLHGTRHVLLRHHEGQVQPRSSLRNHPDIDRVHGVKGAARHSRCVTNVVAHDTDDGPVLF